MMLRNSLILNVDIKRHAVILDRHLIFEPLSQPLLFRHQVIDSLVLLDLEIEGFPHVAALAVDTRVEGGGLSLVFHLCHDYFFVSRSNLLLTHKVALRGGDSINLEPGTSALSKILKHAAWVLIDIFWPILKQ